MAGSAVDWDLFGVFPPDAVYLSCWGYRGVKSYAGDPYPSGVISANSTTITAPGDLLMTVVSLNTIKHQWQVSRNGTSWVNVPHEQTTEYIRSFQYESGVAGTYWYRVELTGVWGIRYTPSIKITVTYHMPEITAGTTTPTVAVPGTVELVGTSVYAESYQWQLSINGGTTWANISGATTLSYSHVVTGADIGDRLYRLRASGLGGTVLSDTVPVSITW